MSGDITIMASARGALDGFHHALAPQSACPLCGCTTRTAHHVDFRSNRYIHAAASHLGVAERLLFDRMISQRCTRCCTIYFDPWLSPTFARELYQRIFPHHNLGWYEFYHFVRTPESALQRSELVTRLRAVVPSFTTYGEIGCPFEGLLPYFATERYAANGEEFYDYLGKFHFDTSIPRNPDVRGNRINLERAGRVCSNLCNWLQLARVFTPRRLKQRYLQRAGRVTRVSQPTIKPVYLEKESSVLWGSHCMSLNVQCRRMAENVLGCGAARVDDHAADEPAFDVIGVFNSLDHYMKPLELLRELLSIARYVYLEGHADREAAKQHSFILDERSLSRLPLPGVRYVDDFSNDTPGMYSVLLCRDR